LGSLFEVSFGDYGDFGKKVGLLSLAAFEAISAGIGCFVCPAPDSAS